LKEVNTFSNLILLLSPLVVSPFVGGAGAAISIAADVLALKTEAINVGGRLLDRILSTDIESSLTKLQRMEGAYCLICFTAFFEAVEQVLPEFAAAAELQAGERLTLSRGAVERLRRSNAGAARSLAEISECGLLDYRITFPHPAEGYDVQKKHLNPLYEELTKGFLAFVEGLQIWEKANETQRSRIQERVRSLPEITLRYFDAQYLVLATKFDEFYVWSNLFQHNSTRRSVQDLSGFVRKYVAITRESDKKIDLGFKRLASAVELLPSQVAAVEPNIALRELEDWYKKAINEPIISDSEGRTADGPALTYPKKSDIFIPQSFKVLRYTQRVQLEAENTWASLPVRTDLGSFLLSYLTSPYSTEFPLIILGHPGSGKSLLTSMLAARLISPVHTPIRVELRNINAENDIASQIEEQVMRTTNRDVRWSSLIDQLKDRPPLILLDGYDELLQASGKVYSGYLVATQRFQQSQEQLIDRPPVRTIITSRITLIDKAQVPLGTTVVRLLEFEEEKRSRWIATWNATNRSYFSRTGFQPFALPQGDEKLLSLAEQPLLLLMLALYDSEGNELHRTGSLDQTALYNSLLRRFVRRELEKGEEFGILPLVEQDDLIDQDMQRLGVAAIGMLNRRALHIRASDLSADLQYLKRERGSQPAAGRALSQGDLLFGSFFFVYESKSAHQSNTPEMRDSDAAFEFLHNTFGEFLTADFILKTILRETDLLREYRSNRNLRSAFMQKQEQPIEFPLDWYSCFVHTPLFSRPVILEMMREWIQHNQASIHDFVEDFDLIVTKEIGMVLSGTSFPEHFANRQSSPFPTFPLTGLAAIYTQNLVLLRTILSSEGFNFDEAQFPAAEDGARTWDRLTHLWRSWFSPDSLRGLRAIYQAKREGSVVRLRARDAFKLLPSRDRLDAVLDVSLALADAASTGFAGLATYDLLGRVPLKLDEIEDLLQSEHINLRLPILVRKLQASRLDGDMDALLRLIETELRDGFDGLARSLLMFPSFFVMTELLVELKRCVDELSPEISARQMRNLYVIIGRLIYTELRFHSLDITTLNSGKAVAFLSALLQLAEAVLPGLPSIHLVEEAAYIIYRSLRDTKLSDSAVTNLASVILTLLLRMKGSRSFRRESDILFDLLDELLRGPHSLPPDALPEKIAIQIVCLMRKRASVHGPVRLFVGWIGFYLNSKQRVSLKMVTELLLLPMTATPELSEIEEIVYRRHVRKLTPDAIANLPIAAVPYLRLLALRYNDSRLHESIEVSVNRQVR
jgi:hypothetical protein